jgi:hypothetical protein
MSEGLKTVYGLDQSEIWDIRSQVKYLNGEHFAALDDLCTRFGGALKSDDPGVPSGTWKDGEEIRKWTVSDADHIAAAPSPVPAETISIRYAT